MAIGFVDGSIILYRGDITRERSCKQKLFRDSNLPVTGLVFKTIPSSIFLYMTTENSIIAYNLTHKDKESKFPLDNYGCAKNCCVLAESTQESHIVVGRNDAIYCYTMDGRGPCYAVEGEKIMLDWFRNYLVIVSKSNQSQSGNLLTVLDIHNKFIVFSATIPSIKTTLCEWGAFYMLDNNNFFHLLDEKDLQSKLSLLFKKNFYDVAIRIAKSQQYDSDGLANIFKQYGDHLCSKGDYSGAIEQYIKTIGKLESSYVIRQFLDSQHIDKLTIYLQALHKLGHATEDHTTLLLNCYTKLNNTIEQSNSLKEFVMMKEGDLNYNVDIAINICRKGNPKEALMLAKKHAKHNWLIKLLIEDHQQYKQVIEYISNLDFENAELYMKKYGKILIENEPIESTQFLKRLCTNFSTKNSIIGSYAEKADPEDYIHLFLHYSECLIELLEYLKADGCSLSVSVYNTFLEHYLHIWKKSKDFAEKNKYSDKLMKLLQDPEAKYDKSQALIMCHSHLFSDGILYLYQEQKLYQQILRHHISKDDPKSILTCCHRFGNQEPTLWIHALWCCIRDTKKVHSDLLNDILTIIAKDRLLSPQLVIDALGSGNIQITLGHLRSYITNELQQEHKKFKEIEELTEKYCKDTEKLKIELHQLKNNQIAIQRSRCAACHLPLELPTIHFLCQHSYHQYCFQSFCEEDNKCPACQPENKCVLELLKAREYNQDLHENFHEQLEKAHDGFSVVAEYFSRGVFNKYKVILDKISIKKPNLTKEINKTMKTVDIADVKNYGLDAEARLKINEDKTRSIVSQTENRVRLQEQPYILNLQSNIKKYANQLNPFENVIEAYCSNDDNNPFKDDADDEDEEYDKTNPFSKDYDDNLNRF